MATGLYWSRMVLLGLFLSSGFSPAVSAQETVCARVKIEIKQELTLERQAFDAEMKINNALDTASLTDVRIVVKVTDENGAPVLISFDPNSADAKFFIRVSSQQNISDIDGAGSVAPATTATINWLLIPAPGSAGVNPAGKKYLVGASLEYRFAGETHTLEVSPDVITVKPLPLLTLDYFLTQDVIADDPFTSEIEAPEPFTLGVRVRNTGAAAAHDLKIDSAQPTITDNQQGLPISFVITGSYVDDAAAQNTLLIDFGDIPPQRAKMGRWLMETNLSGSFVDFEARFSHADELGGQLTSLLQATSAHLLVRDVRVDLPGRDYVRDFLALDGEVLRVYESDSDDTAVTDRSASALLTNVPSLGETATYRLEMPATQGFVYAKVPDPFGGQKALGVPVRSDAKTMLGENVWLSKSKNRNTNQWEYWLNVFDVNSPGVYTVGFEAPSTNDPPVIQFVPDRTVEEGEQVSFVVEASSPNGIPVSLSASPLPTGATFVEESRTSALTRSVFDWTPQEGQAGNYLIVYTASDGSQSSSRSAFVTVDLYAPPAPVTPAIERPAAGSTVTTLQPDLIVRNSDSDKDSTVEVQFEIYADEAMAALVAQGAAAKGTTVGPAGTTSFTPVEPLDDNTRYWWRARSYDGVEIYSSWVAGSFFANLYNDPPEAFNLASPAPGTEVDSDLPTLSWSNTTDLDDDAITYSIHVYADAALTEPVTSAQELPPAEGATSSWTVDVPLTNHATYYWKVIATDSLGAETASSARPFVVNTGNTAPTVPAIASPADQGEVQAIPALLSVQNSTDAENDLLTYVFELDTVSSFDSGNKRSSGQLIEGSGGTTSWEIDTLVENQRYWWRVKAQDGRAESEWAVAGFRMNAANDPPPAPTVGNPGDGAWTGTLQPTLEANPVEDPEDETVSYEFEVFVDANLVNRIATGSSTTTAWVVDTPLADKTTHRWHVRAVDAHGASSGWSEPAVLYVSTGPYQDPAIQMTYPTAPVVPAVDGAAKTVTLTWTGVDQNIEPTVSLYYSTARGAYSGDPIVEGLRKPSGTHEGSYVWDVTGLEPGTYYVYGVIYDARGVGKAYAAGAVVIPTNPQGGSITVNAAANQTTSEAGDQASLEVQLGSAPMHEVTVPINSSRPSEGKPEPSNLVFTPENWTTAQTVTVTGADDCIADGQQTYEIRIGPAVTEDPDYITLRGQSVPLKNQDDLVENDGQSNSAVIRLCNYRIVSQANVNLLTKEVVFTAELTNSADRAYSGVTAKLAYVPPTAEIVEDTLEFGAVGPGETIRSIDTFTIRTTSLSDLLMELGFNGSWEITTHE